MALLNIPQDIAGSGYTFNASAKTVTFTGLTTLTLNQVIEVINTTTNQTIYLLGDVNFSGSITANVLTFTAPNTGMSNTDSLHILLEYARPAGSVSVTNFPASQSVTQGTSPWITNDPGLPDTLGQKNSAGSTSVVLASDQPSVPVTVGNFPSTQNVTVTSSVEVEIKNDTGSPIPVSGTVSVTQSTSPWITNDPGIPDTLGQKTSAGSTSVTIASDQTSIPVTVGNFPATQTVSGTITANQGTAGTQSWKVAEDNSAAINTKLSDGTQQTQITKALIPAFTILQNSAVANGVGINMSVSGYNTAILSITASVAMSGGTTINFEASVDNATWVTIAAHQVGTTSIMTSTTAPGDFRFNIAGYGFLRARISAYSAGTITVNGYAIAGTGIPNTVNANQAGIWNVGIIPSASQVGLLSNRQAALSNTAMSIKASRGGVYGYHFYNPNVSAVFVHIYDLAQGSVTVGTTVPKATYSLPSLGGVDGIFPIPIEMDNAITIACSTAVSSGGAPATGVLTNLFYI